MDQQPPKDHPWAFKFVPQPIQNPEVNASLEDIRAGFKSLAALLDNHLPQTTLEQAQYRRLVLHCLEAAAMYATKVFTHG